MGCGFVSEGLTLSCTARCVPWDVLGGACIDSQTTEWHLPRCSCIPTSFSRHVVCVPSCLVQEPRGMCYQRYARRTVERGRTPAREVSRWPEESTKGTSRPRSGTHSV